MDPSLSIHKLAHVYNLMKLGLLPAKRQCSFCLEMCLIQFHPQFLPTKDLWW
jgi:hypothetical protein